MKTHTISTYFITSLVLYILGIVIAVVLLLTEPQWFDAKVAILPLVIALLLSSIGIAYTIALTAHRPWLTTLGTIALVFLFTFIGFFIVAGVGWLYVLGKAIW